MAGETIGLCQFASRREPTNGEIPMSKSFLTLAALLLLSCLAAQPVYAAEKETLKVVMFVGGGFHDYKQMPKTLAKKIEELVNVDIDIKPVASAEQMAEIFQNPNFADHYDAIIYDICFGENWKDGDYDGALKAAGGGKPAVFIHCSVHTYRPPRDPKAPNLKEREAIADAKWHALVGMDSRVHDPYRPFSTEKAPGAKDQPIVKRFSRRLEDRRRRAVQHGQAHADGRAAADCQEPLQRQDPHRGLGQPLRQGADLRHDPRSRYEDRRRPGLPAAAGLRVAVGVRQAGT